MEVIRFQDEGHNYSCQAEASRATPGVLWWWVEVEGDGQRYAAFRAEPDDTAESVKPRIIAYYAQILVDRARPRITRPAWAQRRPVAPDAGATPAEQPSAPPAG